nr:transmembrane protein 194 [Tanacetum cinerariifolium]
MEVDVGVDVEDEVESIDRGTIVVEVDVVVGIDIPDGMLIPNAVEHLEQVKEGCVIVGGVSGSVTVTLDEVSQGWRYVLHAVGTTLLFLAPIVSEWVPFYYTSSMAIGIFAVVLILLYQ